MEKTFAFYHTQLKELNLLGQLAAQQVRWFTLARLFVFLAASFFLYVAWGKWTLFVILALLLTAVFLMVVAKSVDAKLKLEKLLLQQKIVQQELHVLETRKSDFDAGAEFIDGKHAFSTDLDLFAPYGVFSFFNRTSSKAGKKKLADFFLSGAPNPEQTNRSINYLSGQVEWMQRFRVVALLSSRAKAYDKKIKNFNALDLSNAKLIHVLKWLLPIVSISAIVFNQLELLSTGLCITALFVVFSIIGSELKRTNQLATHLDQYESRFRTMHDQIILLKELDEKELELGSIHELERVQQALKNWNTICSRFELRLNIMVSVPLNIFVAWDFWQRAALEKWQKNQHVLLDEWESKLEEMEALISGATVLYNFRDENCFAQWTTKEAFEFQALSHPLIKAEQVVKNDFNFQEADRFMILTGPNMAGKSTYLRSIGIGIVLANAGFPIFAKTFRLPHVKLFTSMRTADNITENSSYFHAELSRLSRLTEAANANQLLFVLLDEILKGTNSKDKEEGSKKFLKKLSHSRVKGIIATHDLALCTLEQEEPGFSCAFFDSTIIADELSFDYLIKKGICQNMNASFLLKKMKLID